MSRSKYSIIDHLQQAAWEEAYATGLADARKTGLHREERLPKHSELTDDLTIRVEFNGLEVWSGTPAEATAIGFGPEIYDWAAGLVEKILATRTPDTVPLRKALGRGSIVGEPSRSPLTNLWRVVVRTGKVGAQGTTYRYFEFNEGIWVEYYA